MVREANRSTAGRRRCYHNGQGLFAGLPSPLAGCRYHSLAVDEATLPESLEVTARAADGTPMAIEHRTLPVVGLQFHPESILTECGYAAAGGLLGAGRSCDAKRTAEP